MSFNNMNLSAVEPPNVCFKRVQPPHPLAGLSNRTANCVMNYIGHYDNLGCLLGKIQPQVERWPTYAWKDCPKTEVKPRLLAMYYNGVLFHAARRHQCHSNNEIVGWRNFGRKGYVELCVWLDVPPFTPKKHLPTRIVECPHCHKPHPV